MFTGRVETYQPILKTQAARGGIRIFVKKPSFYPHLERGESLSVNGVCLTLEEETQGSFRFFISETTLAITGWSKENLQNRQVNLERPLCFGSSLHGHLVTGHVEAYGEIRKKKPSGEGVILFIAFPAFFCQYVDNKASITVNGVSLTISRVHSEGVFETHLIPETLKKTNLSFLKEGDRVNLEGDIMLKTSQPKNKHRG